MTRRRIIRLVQMETSLHRELKRHFAGPSGRVEVRVGKYRVDAIVESALGPELIEVQHGPLWTIRDKIRRLCRRHRVRIVKPIIARKRLVKRSAAGGMVLGQRFSPRQGQMLELFDDLVYFTRVFPQRNLTIEALLVDIEEWRIPRQRRRRRTGRSYVIEDQRLLSIRESLRLAKPADLRRLITCKLPRPFHTADLAAGLQSDRFTAQRIAYVLRQVGAVRTVGKQRGAWLYEWQSTDRTADAA